MSSTQFQILNPFLSGLASDGDVKMEEAIWSKDGSVVAVRAKVGEEAGQEFSKYFGEFFVDAYDFHKHKAIGVGVNTRQKSRLIKNLIDQQGRRGQTALSLPYASGHEVSAGKMQQFKR